MNILIKILDWYSETTICRQQFWHYMMGEFLPVVYIIAKYNPKNISIQP